MTSMTIQRTLLAAALPALLAVAPAASHAAPDPRVAALVKESGAALHIAAMRDIHVVHMTGTNDAVGLKGTGEGWNEMGGAREASLFSTPPISGGGGWDGSENWNLDQTGLVIVDASVLGQSGGLDQAYFGNYDLWTPNYGGATVTWGGAKSEKGVSYDVLTVAPQGSKVPFDVWFDRTTHLPVRMVSEYGPLESTTILSDFRPVHGLMIPYTVDTTTNTGNDTSFVATSVDIDPADAQARLSKPASKPHDFSIANGATSATIPFELAENHVYVDLMLNGKGPYHFIFDTGGANLVDVDVAKEIGAIGGGGSVQIGGVGDTTEASSFATIKTLQAGDATVTNQVFTVMPVRKGFGLSGGMRVDGLIGYEVLSRFVTTFDYANKQITFHMPGTYTAPAGASVVPISQNGTQPQFACTLDAVSSICTIDTGARDSVSLYTPFMTQNPSVVPATLSATGVNGFGVGGPEFGKLGRLQSLGFGAFTLHDVVTDYSVQKEGAFAMPFLGANVGGGVWKRFAMTLDYDKLTMTLVPNASFDARDTYDRSGLFLINPGAITIVDVRPGTPAAKAGLVKGEVITSVNGSSTMSLRDIRETFLGAPGTVVHLTVKAKDGTTRSVDLALADYV
jgi:hypothetical protein